MAVASVPAEALEVDAVARVTRVVDGDTIRVVILEDLPGPPSLEEGVEYRVRLADINAPEINTREGVEARQALYTLAPPGTRVYLDIDDPTPYDKYGRLEAVVLVEAGEGLVNVNAWLVANGYAKVWDHDNEFNPKEWRTTEPLQAPREDKEDKQAENTILTMIIVAALAVAVLAITLKYLRG